jgi:hypothetical protein
MLAVAIPGDYDQSGVVNSDDYTEWRAHFGEVADDAQSVDGNGNGSIDAADYIVWRKNLGRIAPPNAPAEIQTFSRKRMRFFLAFVARTTCFFRVGSCFRPHTVLMYTSRWRSC